MYFRYRCKHWYEFENDEVERILSGTCTALCYMLEYIYIGQIAKKGKCPVFAFNMQNTTIMIHSTRTAFIKAWVALSVASGYTNLKVVG